MQNNIFLEPTKVNYIKSVRLELPNSQKPKFIGHLNEREKIFRTKRNDYQIYRKTQSIAFNLDLVNQFDIEVFQVEYNGQFLYIAKEHLLNVGQVFHFQKGGAETQLFAQIKEFSGSIKEAKNKLENQLEMFLA